MKTIWKFPLLQPVNDVLVPEGAKVLTVATQKGNPCVWMEVDDERNSIPVTIHAVGTGHAVPANAGTYIGTAIDVVYMGLVFHFYAVGMDW